MRSWSKHKFLGTRLDSKTPTFLASSPAIGSPDAVAKNVIGQIYARFEGDGLKVIAARMMHLSRAEAVIPSEWLRKGG
jgi:hypothetical protein